LTFEAHFSLRTCLKLEGWDEEIIPKWIRPVLDDGNRRRHIRSLSIRRNDPEPGLPFQRQDRNLFNYDPLKTVIEAVTVMMKEQEITLDKGTEEFSFCYSLYYR